MNRHVAIIGCGNIGASLCDLLARLPEIGRLTLVDSDVYTAENVCTQAISRAEIGLSKARAQARRLKRIRPDLQITTHYDTVENLPLGYLKSDVICACLDSRISRMCVNEAAWRLGVPWIDAGVLGSELLVRVEVFLPGMETPCLECGFGEQHYATLEVRHPCQQGQIPSAPPTNAPAYLGAQAASLQAAECHKMLCGPAADVRPGQQILHDLRSHQLFVSQNRRNPLCRFDHRVFAPQEISGRLRLKEILFPDGTSSTPSESTTLYVPGQRFLKDAYCIRCRRRTPAFQWVRNGADLVWTCRSCGESSPIHPFQIQEHLSVQELPVSLLARSPRSLGLHAGDLMTVSDLQGERHYLLGERSDLRRTA